MDLSSKIHTLILDLQQIKSSDGPTALIVIHVQLKTLLFDLLQADPDNLRLIQTYNLLTDNSWKEASAMLDFYEQDQDRVELLHLTGH